jgi:hypothetical protein
MAQLLGEQRRAAEALSELGGQAEQRAAEARRGGTAQDSALAPTQIEALLDVRDRLVIGARTARGRLIASREALERRWLLRVLNAAPQELIEATEALEKGYALSLRRFDELLETQDIHEVECEVGDVYDAKVMRVVDTTSSAELTDDSVAEVLRPGYRQGEQLLRSCEVIVVRNIS